MTLPPGFVTLAAQTSRDRLDPDGHDDGIVLGENTTQARQMLRKLLGASKIQIEGFGEGRERGYKFRSELIVGKLIRAPQITRPTVE